MKALSIGFFGVFLWIVYWADAGEPSVLSTVWDGVPNGDKYGHVILFGALAMAANIVTGFRQLPIGAFKVFWGTLAAVIVAVGEEVSQAWFPMRTVSILDLLASLTGIALATLVSLWWSRRMARA